MSLSTLIEPLKQLLAGYVGAATYYPDQGGLLDVDLAGDSVFATKLEIQLAAAQSHVPVRHR